MQIIALGNLSEVPRSVQGQIESRSVPNSYVISFLCEYGISSYIGDGKESIHPLHREVTFRYPFLCGFAPLIFTYPRVN